MPVISSEALNGLWEHHYSVIDQINNQGYYRSRDPFIEPVATFTELLAGMFGEDYASQCGFCQYCGAPYSGGKCQVTALGKTCNRCIQRHTFVACVVCEKLDRGGNEVQGVDGRICRLCIGNYAYCAKCGLYYAEASAGQHNHWGDCCSSPALSFRMRNDGQEPLTNDTRATITLPAGIIDSEGLKRITTYLQNKGLWDVSDLVPELGDSWQTKEGNFTKRLSKMAYQQFAIRIARDVISEIGNIAAAHSGKTADYAIELTRDVNQPPAAFAHAASCWWGGYEKSRCMLKSNGGFAMRTFDDDKVSGRSWVMPLREKEIKTESANNVVYGPRTDCGCGIIGCTAGPRQIISSTPGETIIETKLVPTFDAEKPSAFIVFNGYGSLEGYTPARIVAYMAGWSYAKVNLTISSTYVNGELGYLVAPEDVIARYKDNHLGIETKYHSDLYDQES